MPTPLDATVLTIASPDGNIQAEIGPGYQARLRVRAGALSRYDEPALENQLSQLARLAWVGYLRNERTALNRSDRSVNTSDSKRRLYRESLRQIEATGTSVGRWVQAWTIGLEQWTFTVAPGAVRRLAEDVLIAEIESAAAQVIVDYELRVVLLKDEMFRFDLPPRIRRRFDEITGR